jgi:acetolactate synthase-1/2/3 large subunit
VITARHEGVPVVVITAQHRMGIVYPSPPSTFQGQDQLEIFKPVVKWSGPILSWDRIPEVMRIAFREMWTGRPGPIQIEIPAPVMYATGDDTKVRVLKPEEYRAAGPRASEAQLEEAATMLASAKRPLVISGAGVDRAGANEAVLALVELLNCPVIGTIAGRSSVPLDHPNSLYGYGAGADLARRESDVILVAGSRMGNLDIPYDKYWGDPANQKLISISATWASRGRLRSGSLPMRKARSTDWCGCSRPSARSRKAAKISRAIGRPRANSVTSDSRLSRRGADRGFIRRTRSR